MKATEETTQLNVEIPVQLHRDVKADAAKEGVKLHELIIRILTNRNEQPARPSRKKRSSFDAALGQSLELEQIAA